MYQTPVCGTEYHGNKTHSYPERKNKTQYLPHGAYLNLCCIIKKHNLTRKWNRKKKNCAQELRI